jgi:hypothetical protein
MQKQLHKFPHTRFISTALPCKRDRFLSVYDYWLQSTEKDSMCTVKAAPATSIFQVRFPTARAVVVQKVPPMNFIYRYGIQTASVV